MGNTVVYDMDQAELDIADLRGQVDRLTEILQLQDSGNQPNTPAAGTFALYSTAGQPSFVTSSTLQMGVQGAQLASFPGNTATGGVVSMASWTIPAKDAAVGAVYEIEVWGNGTNQSNNTMTWEVVAGGHVMSQITLGTGFYGANVIAFRWHMTGRIICHSVGTSATWSSLIFGEIGNFTNNNVPGAGTLDCTGSCSCEATTLTTIDSTSPISLGISALFGSITSGQAITSTVAIPKRVC